MRRFAGIERGDDGISDKITNLDFGHLLEMHGLTEAIFADMNAHLVDMGRTLRSGTLVDATIIRAPSSTQKVNDWYFGMNASAGRPGLRSQLIFWSYSTTAGSVVSPSTIGA